MRPRSLTSLAAANSGSPPGKHRVPAQFTCQCHVSPIPCLYERGSSTARMGESTEYSSVLIMHHLRRSA